MLDAPESRANDGNSASGDTSSTLAIRTNCASDT